MIRRQDTAVSFCRMLPSLECHLGSHVAAQGLGKVSGEFAEWMNAGEGNGLDAG
jgi:hypothetical protein